MRIEKYKFGNLVVDGRSFDSDVIVYPDHVDDSWWRDEGHRVSINDIRDVVDFGPEVIIIGKGDPGLMSVPENTREFIQSKGIELIMLTDILKKMDYLGRRFHKSGLIDHVESLSRLNYKNAISFVNENILSQTENPEDRLRSVERLSQLGQRLYEFSRCRS